MANPGAELRPPARTASARIEGLNTGRSRRTPKTSTGRENIWLNLRPPRGQETRVRTCSSATRPACHRLDPRRELGAFELRASSRRASRRSRPQVTRGTGQAVSPMMARLRFSSAPSSSGGPRGPPTAARGREPAARTRTDGGGERRAPRVSLSRQEGGLDRGQRFPDPPLRGGRRARRAAPAKPGSPMPSRQRDARRKIRRTAAPRHAGARNGGDAADLSLPRAHYLKNSRLSAGPTSARCLLKDRRSAASLLDRFGTKKPNRKQKP